MRANDFADSHRCRWAYPRPEQVVLPQEQQELHLGVVHYFGERDAEEDAQDRRTAAVRSK